MDKDVMEKEGRERRRSNAIESFEGQLIIMFCIIRLLFPHDFFLFLFT